MFSHTPFAQWVEKLIASVIPPALEGHPYDYCLHFGISLVGSLIAWAVLSFLFPKSPSNLRKAIVIVLFACIGVGKELIDPVFGWDDIASDVLGIGVALAIISAFPTEKKA